MLTECCRIFVLGKDFIENILKNNSKDSLVIEACFYNYGAYICASAEDKSILNNFFSRLETEAGFFFLKSSDIDDCSASAEDITGSLLEKNGRTAVSAESCTGGLISKKLTDRSGSSAYFWGSFVTYDNSAKNLLGVKKETLENYGAVSAETVSEMAECAAEKSGADISVSVSGIAGPGGGTEAKPVGTVWFGYRCAEKAGQIKVLFKGSRKDVREKACETALLIIIKNILNEAGVDSITCADYI